jgi:MFS family permease
MRPLSSSPWRAALLPWVIAVATGLEYFDNALFSMFTVHIAGGINAAPDELVWAASAYAVAAVLGIAQQQWWVERLGYRHYVVACLVLFSMASIAALASDSAAGFAVARGLQGYFLGPMMGACRILLQVDFEPARRAIPTRIFLLMILLSSALAPLVGGALIEQFGWQSLFACTAALAALIAPVVLLTLPDSGKVAQDDQTEAHLWPYIVFAAALGAVQIVLQQVRFELFDSSPRLEVLALVGLALIGWFGWHQYRHPRPLLRVDLFREKTFQVGLVLYVLYYYLSNSLGYLSSRLLEGGLAYPVEHTGRLVGLTSFGSIAMLFVYFRYSGRVANKKWLVVSGFVLAAVVGAWFATLPPDVSEPWLIAPLLLRGLLLLFIALPVANITFRSFAAAEFNHSYRIKNIFKQLTYSFATATIITLEQHRGAVHWTDLAELTSPSRPGFQAAFDTLVNTFAMQGHGLAEGRAMATAWIAEQLSRQSTFLSLRDGFLYIVLLALCGGAFAAWQQRIR